jgi:flagellar biosynthesis protein FlhF
MQIRRFEAKNMTAALHRIKEELGPEAVILSARSLRKGRGLLGSLKYAGVEVTAAVDTQLPVPRKAAVPLSGATGYGIYKKNEHAFARNSDDFAAGEAGGRNSSRRQVRQRKKTAVGSGNKKLSILYQQLRSQDVARSIVSDLVEEVKLTPAASGALAEGDMKSFLITALEQIGVSRTSKRSDDPIGGIHALVGTCGVGKTTTIAKLAAWQAIRENRSVGLITMDNYGISALEQLGAYARIIGIPMETAVDRTELKLALKKLKGRDIILIDTPGISPGNSERIQELKRCFAKLADIQTHLVISAATRKKDILSITGVFKQLSIRWLLFTKLDETSSIGNIVNSLVHTDLPLSYLSQGRQVPDDLQRASAEVLAELLLGPDACASPASQQVFDSSAAASPVLEKETAAFDRIVANRNSDVYHLSSCKWARRIKPSNMIEFSDPQEAESRHFLPCRSCNPDRPDSGGGERRENVKLTNYC